MRSPSPRRPRGPFVEKFPYTIGGFNVLFAIDHTLDAKKMTILVPGVDEATAIENLEREMRRDFPGPELVD